jgi:hypothetical protein
VTVALSRRRVRHLQALFAVTIVEMAESQARLADHIDGRAKEWLSPAENLADRRIFLRELIGELDRRGDYQGRDEVGAELGADSEERIGADEALLDAWAARNQVDVELLRANRVRRIQSHLRWVEMANRVLLALPLEEARRVRQDLQDGGNRTPLTKRVREAANRWAELTAKDLEGEPAA